MILRESAQEGAAAGPAQRPSRSRITTAVLCAAAVAAATVAGGSVGAADGGSDGAADGGTVGGYQPAAGFTDTEYSLPFYGTLWGDKDWVLTPAATPTNGVSYFAQVNMAERAGSSLDLRYAVEGQSEGPLHQACQPGEGCNEVNVQVTPDGVLYLYWPRSSQPVSVNNAYLGGFASRAVELSAADAESPLKVYREVAVDPPSESAGCEDYNGGTPEAFTCLFMRELLPAEQAAAADEAALRAKLPKLVQDSANYRLVWAEEFNGAPPAADADGCRDGLSTLDPAVWNYYNACDDVDSRGEPCGNVADGGFTIGIASSCGFGGAVGYLLDTRGHMHTKYGYIETQYTFNIDQWRDVYQNYNMILNLSSGGLHYLRDQYGVEVTSWEDYLKSSHVEIDIFESPSSPSSYRQFDIAHQYANWSGADNPTHLKPIRTLKYTQYCARPGWPRERGIVNNPKGRCSDTDTFTVTKGLEWTPRGYRTYIWVHGLQDGLTLLPKDQIDIQQKVPLHNVTLTVKGRARDQFFENLVPGDDSTLLEQVGVSHIPMPVFLNVWGWLVRPSEGEEGKHPYLRKRMTFDYIRVWQPENHYADMEPVYQ